MAPQITNAQIWGALQAVGTKVDMLSAMMQRADDQAREVREKMYTRIEATNERTTKLEGSLKSVSDDLAEVKEAIIGLPQLQQDMAAMKPTVRGLTDLRLKAAGFIIALGIAATIMGSVLSAFLHDIVNFFMRIIRLP